MIEIRENDALDNNFSENQEFDDNLISEEEKKPIEIRISSPSWRVRKNAYSHLKNEIELHNKESRLKSETVSESNINTNADEVSGETNPPSNITLEKLIKLYLKIFEDSHPISLEFGLDTLISILENFPSVFSDSKELINDFLKLAIEKSYACTKTPVKLKTKELICKILETASKLDNLNSSFEAIKSLLIFSPKRAKSVVLCLQILSFLISEFGGEVIDYNIFMPEIAKLIEGGNHGTRHEAYEVVKEYYRSARANIQSYIANLKPSYLKELKNAFDKIDELMPSPPKPNKVLETTNKINSIDKESNIKNEHIHIEQYSTSPITKREINLLQMYNDEWCDNILSKDRKWTEKKELLEELIQTLSNNKIVYDTLDHQYDLFFSVFRTLLKDSNVNVVLASISALKCLSPILGKQFSNWAKDCLPLILEKFKEKKDKLNKEIILTLESLFRYNITIDQVLPHFVSVSNDKSNQFKLNISELLFVVIKSTYKNVLKSSLKDLAQIFTKLSEEQLIDIRTTSLSCLAMLRLRLGESIFKEEALINLDESKKNKIEEISKTLTYDKLYDIEQINEEETPNKIKINRKNSTKIDESPVKNNSSSFTNVNNFKTLDPTKEKISIDDIPLGRDKNLIVKNKSESDLANPQDELKLTGPYTKNQHQADLDDFERKIEEAMKKEKEKENNIDINSKVSIKPKKIIAKDTKKPNEKGEDEEDTSKLNKEEVEDKIHNLIGEEISLLLQSSKWDEKKNGLSQFLEWLTQTSASNNNLIASNIENIIIFLKIKLKDYKESNFNIIREACLIYSFLISNFVGKGLEKRHSTGLIKGLHEKISDSKVKEQITNLIFTMMENQGPKFISNTLLKYLNNEKKQPGNTILREYALLFERAVDEFGINFTPVKEMVEYCKLLSGNTNPQVRASSTTFLCTLYKFVGADLKFLLKDIKESTLKVIESEFEKVKPLEGPHVAKREVKHIALKDEGVMLPSSKGKENKTPAAALLDSLIPRQDITKKINAKMLKDINTGKWPEKKSAGEELEKVLQDSNMKILPNGLNELFTVFKARLSDGNKNVVRLIVNLLSKLIDALGSGFKTFTKIVSSPLINNLSDKMQLLREDVLVCMDKWVTQAGLDSLIVYIPPLMKADNFEMRTEIFKFLNKHKESFVFVKEKFDLKEFVSPLLLCLQDKSLPIRNSSEEIISYLLRFVPLSNFLGGLKDFKNAIANTLRDILEKFRGVNDHDNSLDGVISHSTMLPTKVDTKTNNLTNITPVKKKEPGDMIKTISKKKVDDNSTSTSNKLVTSSQIIKVVKKNQTSENNLTLSTFKTTSKSNLNSQDDDLSCKSTTIKSSSKLLSTTKNKISVNKKTNFIFLSNNLTGLKTNKDKRLEIDKKFRFNLDTINDDFVNKLKDTFKLIMTSEFVEKIFHEDQKFCIEGMTILQTYLIGENNTNISLIYEVLDLILKWVGCRCITNQNPLLVKVLLEFVETLHISIVNVSFELNDTEGYIILTLLIDKLGNSNSKLRDQARSLIEKYLDKIQGKFTYLVNCCLSRNSKVKVDCVDICTNLIVSSGHTIAPLKDIKTISKMLISTDNSLKNSVVNFLSQLYCQIRDNIWTILNDLPDKVKEMLYNKFESSGLIEEENDYNKNDYDKSEENIKTVGTNSNVNLHSNNEYLNTVTDEIKLTNNKVLEHGGDSLGMLNINNKNNTINSNSNSNNNQPINLSNFNVKDKNDLITILNLLNKGEMTDRVNVILVIHELVFTKFPQSGEILIPNIDMIIRAFVVALRNLFYNKSLEEIPIKLGKYLLTVLYKISSNKELIRNVSYEVLHELSEEVLSNLLIENLDKVGENQEGVIIIRSLNSTMLRILENCNYTHVISVLLELVQKYRKIEQKIKISGLAIKCLLKINQILPQIIDNISVDKILIRIYYLLQDLEKTNPNLVTNDQTDQMIIRYIKNLINELVKLRGESIKLDYLKGMDKPEINDKYLKKWIINILSSIEHTDKTKNSTKSHESESRGVNPLAISQSLVTENSSSNIESLIAYKNKLQQSNAFSKSPTTERKKDINVSNSCVLDTPSKRPRNSEMYYKIINLKSKLASYNNSALSNRTEDNKSQTRTPVENFGDTSPSQEDSNRPVMSKINELKKKWNDVSNKNRDGTLTPDKYKGTKK